MYSTDDVSRWFKYALGRQSHSLNAVVTIVRCIITVTLQPDRHTDEASQKLGFLGQYHMELEHKTKHKTGYHDRNL